MHTFFGIKKLHQVLRTGQPKMSIQITVYIIFLSILFIIYFISQLFRTSSKEITFDKEEWFERVDKYFDKPKICEYCNIKYEKGEKYCRLCGTGLKEPTKE